MKRIAFFALAALLLSLAPPHARAQGAAPPLAPDKARLYVYRLPATYGTMIWTAVYLNGAYVGDSGPGSYIFRDVAPGTYQVTLRSQGMVENQFATATVAAGSTTYIRVTSIDYFGLSGGGIGAAGAGPFSSAGGLYSQPTFVDQVMNPAQAQREIASLRPAE